MTPLAKKTASLRFQQEASQTMTAFHNCKVGGEGEKSPGRTSSQRRTCIAAVFLLRRE